MINAHKKHLSLIVAVDEAGGFAKNGTIPWDEPEDMAHFIKLTKGAVCIMGKGTYNDMVAIQATKSPDNKYKSNDNSILPGRTCYVISSDETFEPEGATRASSITDAVNQITDENIWSKPVFILGGPRLFIEALSKGCDVYMTIIKGSPHACDQTFPIDILNRRYNIVTGTETEKCYFVTYHSKPTVARESEEDMWNRIINENFRPVRGPSGPQK